MIDDWLEENTVAVVDLSIRLKVLFNVEDSYLSLGFYLLFDVNVKLERPSLSRWDTLHAQVNFR